MMAIGAGAVFAVTFLRRRAAAAAISSRRRSGSNEADGEGLALAAAAGFFTGVAVFAAVGFGAAGAGLAAFAAGFAGAALAADRFGAAFAGDAFTALRALVLDFADLAADGFLAAVFFAVIYFSLAIPQGAFKGAAIAYPVNVWLTAGS